MNGYAFNAVIVGYILVLLALALNGLTGNDTGVLFAVGALAFAYFDNCVAAAQLNKYGETKVKGNHVLQTLMVACVLISYLIWYL